MIRVRHTAHALIVALGAWACAAEPGPPLLRPVQRFVDVGVRAEAVLSDETRTVLEAPRSAHLLAIDDLKVAPGEAIQRQLRLPKAWSSVRRVVLQTRYRTGSRWQTRPPQLAEVQASPDGSALPFELKLGASARQVDVRVFGYALADSPRTRYETGRFDVPRDAVLEFGLGILASAWKQGPVRFMISACEAGECELVFSEHVDPELTDQRAWIDRSLSLPDHAGSQILLRFETEHLSSESNSFSLPVWANPTLYVTSERQADEPNLLLISLDTLGAGHLTPYGYQRETSPFMAEIAERGTLFEKCFSAATTTGPSHMTLFTSLQPSAHRVFGNRYRRGLPKSVGTLPEQLRALGMETAAFTENGALVGHLGFSRGFNLWSENKGASSKETKGWVEETFRRGRGWLERHRSQRFFLFLHTYQVHSPYTPPRRYREHFKKDGLTGGAGSKLPRSWRPELYDREIRYVDDSLRELFAWLEEAQLLENTLVVVTSDHGEAFAEHGWVAHGSVLYDQVLHVPLLFHGPSVPRGRRVTAPVSLGDLAPTLLERLNAPPLPLALGRSFLGLLHGDSSDGGWEERPIFSESWSPRGFKLIGRRLKKIPRKTPGLAVRIGSRKLLRTRNGDGFEYHYFDLNQDPGEMTDRYAELADQLVEMRESLDRYESVMAALREDLENSSASGDQQPVILDPDREEKLRALGYIN